MTTLPQAHDVDLESANCDGGGGIRHRHVAAVGEGGEAAAEINNVNDEGKDKPEKRKSNASDSVADPEAGANDIKLNVGKDDERDCRICMLGLDEDIETYGGPLELGCTCKDDLGVAHKNCAETWFKMRGNITCEICGSIAQNVHIVFEGRPANEPWNQEHRTIIPPAPISQSTNYYPGRRLLNFILVLVILIFILCWLFHFHWPTVKTIY